jgi:GAF domain-containing protein
MSDAALQSCIRALGAPGQPAPLYRALDQALGDVIGHKLFTLLYVAPDRRRVKRVYSSNPAAYPVGGFKEMGPTPWGAHVIEGRKPYVGRNAADIRWAFPDHAQIASLGLESALNVPVSYDGRCLGTMNLLDAAGRYRDEHGAAAAPYAALLVGPFLEAIARDRD